MNLGYAEFADTLLTAAKEQDQRRVHAAFVMIYALDGDAGIRAMLGTVLDQATAGLPAPEGDDFYTLSAFAFTLGSTATSECIDEMPYELGWSLRMISARLNGDTESIESLIASAQADDRLSTCSLTLALVAGQTSYQGVGRE
ncbi:hypothetical protein [Streptomonospora salina]|uniref:Uncharacterized protein n=1 Tax=Streptomonospora salina TaxID=104205 RepID=A0A841EB94_9ACTN|nr:hypothetical protein [Streptomonospora salina]MBB6000256.1 hypothetical protein [Streptomonospora salina]